MRAVVVHEFGNFDSAGVEQRPDPIPDEHHVVVEVKAVPVNYVDLVTVRGEYQFNPELPYTPGKGPAGVVREVGASVSDVTPGDRVLAMAEQGGYAELARVERCQVHHLPPELSFEEAASLSLAYDTAWMALRDRARLERGESVLVLGASGAVGQAAVQLARAMGASKVIAGVSRSGRPAGPADDVVDLSTPDLRNSLRDQIGEITHGAGVDVIIDPLGGDAFDGAVRSLAWRGRLVVVGFAAGRIPVLKLNYPLLKNIEISGLQISDYRKRLPDLVSKAYQEIFGLYVQGKITPSTYTTFPLTEWRTALETIGNAPADVRQLLVP